MFHNSDPSESARRHFAYPNPVPRMLAAPLEVHETNWEVSALFCMGFPDALLKYRHRPNSP